MFVVWRCVCLCVWEREREFVVCVCLWVCVCYLSSEKFCNARSVDGGKRRGWTVGRRHPTDVLRSMWGKVLRRNVTEMSSVQAQKQDSSVRGSEPSALLNLLPPAHQPLLPSHLFCLFFFFSLYGPSQQFYCPPLSLSHSLPGLLSRAVNSSSR